MPNRRAVLALAAGAIAWPLAGRAGPAQTIGGTAFGTTWQALLPAGADAGAVGPAIAAAFAEVDRQMSPWRADSEVSRLNAGAAGAHPISRDTAQVAAAALELAARSGGVFDPTVGPSVARWGFGPIRGSAACSPSDLAVEGGAVIKHNAGATLDLCGIAKGHALDRAVALLRAADLRDALFDLGGELATLGTRPDGGPWRVGVEDPRGGAEPVAVLALPPGLAVATSGVTTQGYRAGARLFSHIIDPRTDEPVTGALLSVSVVADTGTGADGWATALLAAGERDGPALAARMGIDALFVLADGAGLRTVPTHRIGRLMS